VQHYYSTPRRRGPEEHPLVSPLISLIARFFFVSFPAIFLCGFPPGLTTGFLRNFTRNVIREIVVDRVAQVHLLYELDSRARPRITLEVPQWATIASAAPTPLARGAAQAGYN
jgi:hypothetical protein